MLRANGDPANRSASTSRFVGVHRTRRRRARPWIAMAGVPTAAHPYLGAWKTQREAAEAYDRAVIYYRGVGRSAEPSWEAIGSLERSRVAGRGARPSEAAHLELVSRRRPCGPIMVGPGEGSGPPYRARSLAHGDRRREGLRPSGRLLSSRHAYPQLPRPAPRPVREIDRTNWPRNRVVDGSREGLTMQAARRIWHGR
jgi:hypothetical protein